MQPATFIFTLLILTLSKSELRIEGAAPICIIGGGIGGLSLAIRLQDKGYTVSLFEKSSRFGGKLDTYKNLKEGLLLEKGPVFFSPFNTSNTFKYARRYNMTIIPYDVHDQAVYNPERGIFGRAFIYQKQRDKLVEYAKKYASFYNHSELSEVGFPNIDPNSDYAKPTSVWLEEKGLTPLEPMFYFLLTVMGYGGLKETPALYALKYVLPEVLIPILELKIPFATVAEGFGVLGERIAVSVKSKFPRHEVVDLVRKNGRQEVTFLVDGKSERTYTCSKTVITFIPILSNIMPVVRDLTSEEESVLSMVKVNKYASSGHTIPLMKHWIYMAAIPKSIVPVGNNVLPHIEYPKGQGQVIAFGKGKGTNPQGYVGYSWLAGDYDSEGTVRDEEMMKRKQLYTVKKIHPFSKTHFFKSYQYFPHVTGKSIREGFYQKLEAMQGNGGLYYACPLLTFDYIHSTIEMGEKFADKFF